MTNENKKFVEEYANPHAWLMVASNLHEQATAIYKGRSRSPITTQFNAKREVVRQARDIDKSVFLLGGFALENAIKAFLVFENPSWVSGGRLSKKLRSHVLTDLQRQSQQVPYKSRYVAVLKAFQSGLDSWFRYPCALTVEDTLDEGHLYDHLWDDYGKVMHAYGKKLMTLLSRGWKGPEGYFGRWTFEGEFFGYHTPFRARTPRLYSEG